MQKNSLHKLLFSQALAEVVHTQKRPHGRFGELQRRLREEPEDNQEVALAHTETRLTGDYQGYMSDLLEQFNK
jgi:hypothetical protein